MKIEHIFNEKTVIEAEKFDVIKKIYELKEKDYSSKVENDGKIYYYLKFVGFIAKADGRVLVSLPLNYLFDRSNTGEEVNAFIKVIRTINKHNTTSKDFYISKEGKNSINTNYPFVSFFEIYDYFSKYGLHFNFNKRTTSKVSSKINWKKTISKTNYYLNNNELVFYPIYYDQKYKNDTFITKCMIDSINSTLQKFNLFIGLNDTGIPTPEYNFDAEYTVSRLLEIQTAVFNENEKQLISSLINFYEDKNYSRDDIYFKHYAYYDVWEKMVHHYLNYHFKSIDSSNNIIYDHTPTYRGFKKERFHPNNTNKNQYMEVDFYLTENDTQYIFDAKYQELNSLDYKQLVYYYLLKDYVPDNIWSILNDNSENMKNAMHHYKKTYSAMFTPYSKWEDTIIHFQPELQFSRDNREMYILEDRMLINDVIDYWLK